LIDVNSGEKFAFNRGKKSAPYEKSSMMVDKPFLRHSFRASLKKKQVRDDIRPLGRQKLRREE